MSNVRIVELESGEVFVDVNDLIIGLLLEAESSSDDKRKALKDLAHRLREARDKAHKIGVGKTHVQKL